VGETCVVTTINVKKRRFEPCGKPATFVYKTHPEGAGMPNCREHAEVALEILEKGDAGHLMVLTWDDTAEVSKDG
jgi:hypothetical protein